MFMILGLKSLYRRLLSRRRPSRSTWKSLPSDPTLVRSVESTYGVHTFEMRAEKPGINDARTCDPVLFVNQASLLPALVGRLTSTLYRSQSTDYSLPTQQHPWNSRGRGNKSSLSS